MKHFSPSQLGKRLAQLVLSLFILLAVTFVIGRVLPTDPVGSIVGELADPAAYAAMRERLGLNLPVYEQFFVYLWNLLHGDLGMAALTGNPVSSDLAQAFPATMELATLAIFISAFVGVPLGLAAALFRDTWIDQTARVVSLVGHSIPVFWLGIIGLLIFYAGLGWVGGPGRLDVYYEGLVPSVTGMLLVDSLLAGEKEIFFNALSHIALPAFMLAYSAMAYITRMTRSFTLEQLGQDYVIAARAKGVSPRRTLFRHILPNIAVQLVTVLAISYGALLEGAVVTEIVFSWPGIGQYMTSALLIGDVNAVTATTIVIGIVFMLLNFLSDIAYAVLDPRTREATS
ncbi:ABC transporter permease [Consotaella salsifontis]|uniref:Peptide/nickel transport system permease protein n=1 Tax=Consotaella salsifontis TaxID=1365950 RepID=A0A1T4RM81_9HYPH|nr:ABC transporter permease [Consotaella salsifontis]SKA17007.1 peptide/nickel transport system permease protein [Consotaella salsifontis]